MHMREMRQLCEVRLIVRSTTHLDLIRARLECALDLLLVGARQLTSALVGLLEADGLLLNLGNEATGIFLKGSDAFLLARETRLRLCQLLLQREHLKAAALL
jgi:hypothetical protein